MSSRFRVSTNCRATATFDERHEQSCDVVAISDTGAFGAAVCTLTNNGQQPHSGGDVPPGEYLVDPFEKPDRDQAAQPQLMKIASESHDGDTHTWEFASPAGGQSMRVEITPK